MIYRLPTTALFNSVVIVLCATFLAGSNFSLLGLLNDDNSSDRVVAYYQEDAASCGSGESSCGDSDSCCFSSTDSCCCTGTYDSGSEDDSGSSRFAHSIFDPNCGGGTSYSALTNLTFVVPRNSSDDVSRDPAVLYLFVVDNDDESLSIMRRTHYVKSPRLFLLHQSFLC